MQNRMLLLHLTHPNLSSYRRQLCIKDTVGRYGWTAIVNIDIRERKYECSPVTENRIVTADLCRKNTKRRTIF